MLLRFVALPPLSHIFIDVALAFLPSMSVKRKVTVPVGSSGIGHLLQGIGDGLLQRHRLALRPFYGSLLHQFALSSHAWYLIIGALGL